MGAGAVIAATSVAQIASGLSRGSALSPLPPRRLGFLFDGELPVTFLPGGRIRLERDLVYADDVDGTRVIPQGLISDGTSSPALSWMFIGHPYSYSLLPPSLQHDLDLQHAVAAQRNGHAHDSRAEIDRRYHRALRLWGVGRIRAALIYRGVRLKAVLTGRDFAAREVLA